MNKKKQGKKNKAAGARFELKVRHDLESKGWIVDKWSNNVEFLDGLSISCEKGKKIEANRFHMKGKLIPAKRKYCGPKIPMAIGTGFPDFVAFIKSELRSSILDHDYLNIKNVRCDYAVIGVEVKSNGYLDPKEREKCKWLSNNNIFSKILIAKKGSKRGKIIYQEFQDA